MACGCCLYGPYISIPIIFCFIASFLTWWVTYDCRFFESTQDKLFWEGDDGGVPLRAGEEYTFTVGPWTVQDFYPNGTYFTGTSIFTGNVVVDDNSCTIWSEHETLSTGDLDAPLRWVRGMTMTAAYATLILFPLTFAMIFATYPRIAIQLMSAAFFLESTLVILSFILLLSYLCKEAKGCKIRADSYVSIVAWVFWVGAAISILFVEETKWGGYDEEEPLSPGTTETVDEIIDEKTGAVIIVTMTVTINEDGTKITKEVREPQPKVKKYLTKTGLSVRTSSIMVGSSKVQESGEEEVDVDEEQAPAEEGKEADEEAPAEDEDNKATDGGEAEKEDADA